MTSTNPPDRVAPPRRLRDLLLAAAVLAGSAAWLVVTADGSPLVRRIAGLWRARDVLVAGAGLWAAALLAARACSRSVLLRLVALTLAAAATLGLVELVGVLRIVDYARLFGNAGGEVLGSKPIPNADVTGTTWEDTASTWGLPTQPVPFHFKTDRRGYRNETDRDAADVYLLGDSCLVGALVPFEQTLCGRLEAAIRRPVMNVALIAIGVQEERDRFRDAKLDVRGRLVVQFVFEGNDQADSAAYRDRATEPAAQSPPGGRSFTFNALLTLQRWTDPVHPVARRRTGYIGDTIYTFFWTRDQFQGRDEEIPEITGALDDMRRIVEAAGGVYAVVVIPDKLRVLGPLCRWPPESELTDYRAHCSDLPRAVADWGARVNVEVLDLTASLRSCAEGGRIPWFSGDTHWNATGHEVAGREIAAWIASHHWPTSR